MAAVRRSTRTKAPVKSYKPEQQTEEDPVEEREEDEVSSGSSRDEESVEAPPKAKSPGAKQTAKKRAVRTKSVKLSKRIPTSKAAKTKKLRDLKQYLAKLHPESLLLKFLDPNFELEGKEISDQTVFKLLLESIGCFLSVEDVDFDDMDDEQWGEWVTDAVHEMRTDDASKPLVCVDDYIKSRNGASEGGVLLYEGFWRSIFDHLLNSLEHADLVAALTKIISSVTQIVCVGQPDIRLVSVVTILKLGEEILKYKGTLTKKLATAERQMGRSAKNRRNSLEGSVKTFERKIGELDTAMQEIMSGVFVHRYRDVDCVIRKVCLRYLNRYIMLDQDTYLTNQWTKYLGWMLSDEDPSVRCIAVQGLKEPLKSLEEAEAENMKPVINKFMDRLVDLSIDVDSGVALESIELLLLMLKGGFMDDLEDESSWEQVNLLALDPISDTEATDLQKTQIRKFALEFVIEQLEAFEDDDVVQSKQDMEKTTLTQLTSLVSWVSHVLHTTPIPLKSVSYVTTSLSLIPKFSYMVKDLSYLVKLLMEDRVAATHDNLKADEAVDALQGRVLSAMLSGAVKLGAKSLSPLAKQFPKLLQKFASDSIILTELTRLASSDFDLQERSTLLKCYKKTFLEIRNVDCWQNLATGIRALDGSHVALEIANSLVERLKEYTEKLEEDNSDQDNMHAVHHTVRAYSVLVANVRADNIPIGKMSKPVSDLLGELLEEELSDVSVGVISSVSDVLYFKLLWAVYSLNSSEDNDHNSSNNETNERDLESKRNGIINERKEFVKMMGKCFDFFSEDMQHNEIELQKKAISMSSDIRMLFSKVSAMPLSDDEEQLLMRGSVRFFRSQEDTLKGSDSNDRSKEEAVTSMLLPLCKALENNWPGNRKECGVMLSHIVNSTKDATNIVNALQKNLKKIDNVRLLEAHMAALRQNYELWLDMEPEEITSDRPSDEEMAKFEAEEKQHQEMFEKLEGLSARFSATLGVGKLKDPILIQALQGFLKEGVRFAFSTDEDFYLGGRLSFLSLLGKYVNWIRKNKDHVAALVEYLDEQEDDLRNDADFEQVDAEDMKILKAFRVALTGKSVKGQSSGNGRDSVSVAGTVADDNDDQSMTSRTVHTVQTAYTGQTAQTGQSFSTRGAATETPLTARSSIRTKSTLSPLPEEDSHAESTSQSNSSRSSTKTGSNKTLHSVPEQDDGEESHSSTSSFSTENKTSRSAHVLRGKKRLSYGKSQATYDGRSQSTFGGDEDDEASGGEESNYASIFANDTTQGSRKKKKTRSRN